MNQEIIHIEPLADIKQIGNKIILSNDYSMDNINKIVNEFFEVVKTK